ncbi:hypothetical protein MSG28_003887 [Choristoneura fumiferana]|uniref:Uncharacterized protein n=1 Tax=Choristoneura fumiferana TaxID=7141 RepID=A0ACC0KHS8_CHOFU|nr:hypothetical protein MSG28_003887 [Choristoneura fumiferana]
MSGSQHNPNGRQAQLGSGWSPLQMANLLARAPQAHMASDRGVTWHTPTPPPHLYHVPAPSPPDPLQAMKGAGNSVFRHTATPPELYRHTPTPPDKHLLRHTPSPGDVKAGAPLPPADLYAHMGPGRDKLVRPEDLLTYARGVDLSLSSRNANGAPAHAASPALSVRDAPTINSLIARVQPRPHHARVDSLLERLVPSPVSPHSVIMHSRAAPTPSPPSSNEDSADSCGAPPGSKRKRKPERTIRVPTLPPIPIPIPPPITRLSPPKELVENGDTHVRNGPETVEKERPATPPVEPHARRKTRRGAKEPQKEEPAPAEPPVTIDKLKSVLASPTKEDKVEEVSNRHPRYVILMIADYYYTPTYLAGREEGEPPPEPVVEAAAPRRRSARASNTETTRRLGVPVKGKPAEPEPAAAAAPHAASFRRGEQQVEKEKPQTTKARKRRKSAPTKGERKAARRCSRASTGEDKKKGKKAAKKSKEAPKDAYDSGSNASSSRSRGPYIQSRRGLANRPKVAHSSSSSSS